VSWSNRKPGGGVGMDGGRESRHQPIHSTSARSRNDGSNPVAPKHRQCHRVSHFVPQLAAAPSGRRLVNEGSMPRLKAMETTLVEAAAARQLGGVLLVAAGVGLAVMRRRSRHDWPIGSAARPRGGGSAGRT
jgi:hypothetical protein